MSTALWPHQEEAVKAAVAEIGTGGRCQVIMACGTGKTLVGAEVSRQVAADGKVLVVVPTLELLSQTARAYTAAPGAGAVRAVCSGSAEHTISQAELLDEMSRLHAGVSTDPDVVAGWLRVPGRTTVLATYQSLAAVAAACRTAGSGWDLIVIDEAHRSAGRTDRAWHIIHDDKAIPAARRLFMTATPRLLTSQRHEVAGMDDERVFGPEVYRLTFAQAIGGGLLADYRVAVTVVTDAEVAELASGKRVVSAGGPSVTGAMLASQVALLKACARWGLRRVITYHHRVASAHRFAGTLLNAADLLPEGEKPRVVHADAVDGTMPLWRRRDILRRLEAPAGGRTAVVSNARVLSEGVDVPELDGVMFADPRDSGTDIVQAVGRALRRGSRKGKTAVIIVPVLLAEMENPEAALDGSAYDMVWKVVRALRAHDERLADWLDARRASRTGGDRSFPPGNVGGLLEWMTITGRPVTASFASALQVRMIDVTTTSWPQGIAAARAWHAATGGLAVPSGEVTADGFAFGAWLSRQRTLRRQGMLASARQAELDVLGMEWDVFGSRWQRGREALSAYRAAHGHADVPQDYVSGDGFRLGEWVSNQRARFKAGTMPAVRRAALDALGMIWERDADAAWQRGIAAARAFREQHGHLAVPKGWMHDGLNLNLWLQDRRKQQRAGTLSAGRAADLEALGFAWDPHEEKWRAGLAALERFRAANGHVNVPKDYTDPEGVNLYLFTQNRRSEWRRGILAPWKEEAMTALGFTWDPYLKDWEDGLADCRDWHAAHGHLDIPNRAAGTRIKALGVWLSRRRKERAAGDLAPEREAALEALGINWVPPRSRAR